MKEKSCKADKGGLKMNKYPIQIDMQAYKSKPSGNEIARIKYRTQKSEVKAMTIDEIEKVIETGHSFSLGILKGGLGANNWTEQQLFGVDIDNEKEGLPILTPKNAIEICKQNNILPAIIYLTYSNTKEKPKFRLIFAFDKPVKDEKTRKAIMETLISLFLQADTSCINADRIYFGTNQQVKCFNKENNLDDFKNRFITKKQTRQEVQYTSEQQNELEKLKKEFDFEKFLDVECGEVIRENDTSKTYKNCKICGHKECFVYYKDTKTWHCFGANGNKGGSIIDYLMHTKKMSQNEAINYFKYNLCNMPPINTKAEKQNTPIEKLSLMSASELINKEFPPILWAVNNLIPQGLTLLASKPKLGKSWLVLSMGLSVASGKDFIGFTTEQSDVLYLALEDSNHRLKARLNKILDDAALPPDNFYFTTSAPSLENGLVETLEKHIMRHSKTKLVIIDTLQKVRSGCKKGEGAYSADYRELSELKNFADKHNICLLVVHHVRKAKVNNDDPFDKISGTNGIFGTADTALIMQKDKKESYECELHVTGRDVENDKYILVFDKNACQWTCIGNSEAQEEKREIQEYNDDGLTKAIRKLLKNNSYWKGTAQELLNAFKDNLKIELQESPESIGKKLRKYASLFQSIDSISYTAPPEHGSGGKRIHELRSGMQIMEDDPVLKDLF